MSNQNIPVFFVTADLAVSYGEIYAAGKSGGCGYPVATKWMIDPDSVRHATDAERAEHADLIADMTADVSNARVLGGDGRWYIASDTTLIHARIGYPVTNRLEWGHSNRQFWLCLYAPGKPYHAPLFCE